MMNKAIGVISFYFLATFTGSVAKKPDPDGCNHCKFMIKTFQKGLEKTSNQHFGGGNTDWEERKLGKFKTSESRFVEIMEYVCNKDIVDTEEFGSVNNLKFKCQRLAEDNEEVLENWFFKRQETQPDIEKFICVEELKKCCPEHHYGPNCAPCPGALVGAACFNRGKCNGDGTTLGTGKCECQKGYAGVRCSNCAAHYYPASQNDTSIDCRACFDGCATSCKGPTPLDCTACRSGWRWADEHGCTDVDECTEAKEPLCDKTDEICVNTPGNYSCECKEGYKRDFDTDECILDVRADQYDGIWRPDRILRYIALSGLIAVASFVIFFHPSKIALAFLAISVGVVAIIESRVDENLVPDEAKKAFSNFL